MRGRNVIGETVAGLDLDLETNLQSYFEQDYPDFEILFAARQADDPAWAIVENKYGCPVSSSSWPSCVSKLPKLRKKICRCALSALFTEMILAISCNESATGFAPGAGK